MAAYALARATADEVAALLDEVWAGPDAVPDVRASLDDDGHPLVIIAPVTPATAQRLGALLTRMGCAA